MNVQVEFWQFVTVLITFFGAVAAGVRLLFAQFEKRLAERFKSMDDARAQAGQHWDERFTALLEQNRRELEGWQTLERDFLKFQAELPVQYVRREDYVRNQTVIEAKLDAVALKIENLQLKGAQR